MPLSAISSLRSNLARLKRQLIVGNCVFLAVVLLTAALAAKSSYDSHQNRALQTVVGMVQTLSLDVGESLAHIDRTLLSTLRQISRLEARGPLTAKELMDVTEEQRSLVPTMTALRLTHADGLVLTSGEQPGVSLADRDYYLAAKARPDSLVVSDPLKGRVQNVWGLILARARTSADGKFLGVIYGGVTTAALNDLFRSASVGPKGAVALRTIGLKLVVRYSPIESDPYAGVGTSNVSDALRDAVSANPNQGSFRTRTALDGIERVTAYKKLPGYPMLLAVGLATEDFLVPWWSQLWTIGSLALMLEVLVLAFSYIVFRAHQQQNQSGEVIARLAQERGVLLDNDLVGMVKVRDRHSVWHNKAFAQLFGYRPSELDKHPSRMFYLDEESYARVGQGYASLASGSTFRTQLEMARKDGTRIWIDLSGTALEGGESLWLMMDINAIKRSEEQARHLAFHDALTGLPNRYLLAERLDFLLKDAERRQARLAVCYLDLDGFKGVNDQMGHDAGDALLRAAAQRLTACIRANDVVARIGGDEFVVVLNQPGTDEGIEQALGRLIDAFVPAVSLPGGIEARVGVSVGVALYPHHAHTVAELLYLADQAMLAGKRNGKGRWVLHEPA